MKIKDNWLYFIIFILIIVVISIFYWECHENYFFSDDFHWLGRGVLAQDSPQEIFKIEGKDFNPVFLALLTVLIKIFGLSPLVFRTFSILLFSAVLWMFFYIQIRYFKIHVLIAFSVTLLAGLSVYVSEVILNLSAMVYLLSMLFYLSAIKFYFNHPKHSISNSIKNLEKQNKKKWAEFKYIKNIGKNQWLYFLFLSLAFLTKEIVILAVIPLFFLEREKSNRIFLIASSSILVIVRILLQTTAANSSYTSFLTPDYYFYKLYFILMRSMSLSPYSLSLLLGILVILIFLTISIYFIKMDRGMIYFILFLGVFSLFFSFLPKLSSRYFFYPTFGFWGIAALICHHFMQKKRILKYAMIPLLFISIPLNYMLIKREIEDYRILGNFSHQYIQHHAASIKKQINNNKDLSEIILYKMGRQPLASLYQKINHRQNLPKLLPFRANSIDGVIELRHLIPIIFYPDSITRWHLKGETPLFYKGKIFQDNVKN